MPSIIMIFGLPCTGKSTIATLLAKNGFQGIKVDEYVSTVKPNPRKEDFCSLSPLITDQIYNALVAEKHRNWSVEMGCLMGLKDVERLIGKLNSDFQVITVLLTTQLQVAANRAISRNKQIEQNASDAVKIDEPLKIGDFIGYFETSRLPFTLEIDTTYMKPDSAQTQILKAIQ